MSNTKHFEIFDYIERLLDAFQEGGPNRPLEGCKVVYVGRAWLIQAPTTGTIPEFWFVSQYSGATGLEGVKIHRWSVYRDTALLGLIELGHVRELDVKAYQEYLCELFRRT